MVPAFISTAVSVPPFDQRLQLALFDKATGEIVEPDRLTMLVQRFHGVHVTLSLKYAVMLHLDRLDR
jgi:hypothetical protein